MYEISVKITENVGVFDRLEASLRFTDEHDVETFETIEADTKDELKNKVVDQVRTRLDEMFEF